MVFTIRTLQDYLKIVLEFWWHHAVPKQWVTKVHRAWRLTFALVHKIWTTEQWRCVLWMDEATFTLSGSTNKYMHQQQGSNPLEFHYTIQRTKHPNPLMVWGSFSYNGIGALMFLPNVKMNQYLELLSDHLSQSLSQCNAKFLHRMGHPATLFNMSQSGLMIIVSPILISG